MAFWTNLINAIFLPGRPILGSTGVALRDNMIAIAEGAPDAPRISPVALAMPGVTTPVKVSGATYGAFTGLDLIAQLAVYSIGYNTGGSGSASNLQVAFQTGGSAWGSDQTLCSGLITAGCDMFAMFDLVAKTNGGVFRASGTGAQEVNNVNNVTIPDNVTGIRFKYSAAITQRGIGLVALSLGGRT